MTCKSALKGPYLAVDPEGVPQAEGVLLALLPHVDMLVDALGHLPGDRQVVLPLAAGPDDEVALVHGLHHLLRLLEVDVVERRVGDHALDVRYAACRGEGERWER